jgi:protein arginine kinase activator
MLCDECGKKEAVFKEIQIGKNRKKILNLCQDCAKKHEFSADLPAITFSIGNMLASFIKQSEAESTKPLPKVKCSVCGLSYGEFRQHGRLGCSRCYETFFDNLKDLLRRIHGSNDHVGKVPRSAREEFIARKELKKLQQEMRRAVEKEEFEKAANLRDQIRRLELKGADKTSSGGSP